MMDKDKSEAAFPGLSHGQSWDGDYGQAHAGTFQLLTTLRDSASIGVKGRKRKKNRAYRFSLLLLMHVDRC